MDAYQLTLLTIFMVLAYFVATDESIAEYVNLIIQGAWVQIQKYYLMARFHPFWYTNPVGKWWMMRKYRRMAQDMLQSIKEDQPES